MHTKESLDLLSSGKVTLVLVLIYFYTILFTQNGGVNVIPGHDTQTTTPNIPVEDITGNKTENQFKNRTDEDGRENSAHPETNLAEETRTNIVAIFVLLTIISALALYLVVVLRKTEKVYCKRTQRQGTESHEMTEPLNNQQYCT